MGSTFSAEFTDTPAGRASIGLVVQDLLAAKRQFTCSPQFDVGPEGLHLTSGFLLSWPGAVESLETADALTAPVAA